MKLTEKTMTRSGTARFPIRFDKGYGLVSSALLLPPSNAYVEIDGNQVQVRMGWAFTHQSII